MKDENKVEMVEEVEVEVIEEAEESETFGSKIKAFAKKHKKKITAGVITGCALAAGYMLGRNAAEHEIDDEDNYTTDIMEIEISVSDEPESENE